MTSARSQSERLAPNALRQEALRKEPRLFSKKPCLISFVPIYLVFTALKSIEGRIMEVLSSQ